MSKLVYPHTPRKPKISPLHCALLTLAAMAPCLYKTLVMPTKKNLLLGYCLSATASFIFGWHVHEKAILLVLLPLAAVAVLDSKNLARPFIIMSTAGISGVLPLVFSQFEQVNRSVPDSLMCVGSRVRQIGAFRPLRRDCARLKDRRMS